jgi:hypothetical protein
MKKVAKPDCYAVDYHHLCIFRQGFQRRCEINRFLDSMVRGAALTAVTFNAGPHLIIGGFGCGNESSILMGRS